MRLRVTCGCDSSGDQWYHIGRCQWYDHNIVRRSQTLGPHLAPISPLRNLPVKWVLVLLTVLILLEWGPPYQRDHLQWSAGNVLLLSRLRTELCPHNCQPSTGWIMCGCGVWVWVGGVPLSLEPHFQCYQPRWVWTPQPLNPCHMTSPPSFESSPHIEGVQPCEANFMAPTLTRCNTRHYWPAYDGYGETIEIIFDAWSAVINMRGRDEPAGD